MRGLEMRQPIARKSAQFIFSGRSAAFQHDKRMRSLAPTLVRDPYNTNLIADCSKPGPTPLVLVPAKRPQRLSQPQQNHIVAPCAEKVGD